MVIINILRKKYIKKIINLALSLPSGYFYNIKISNQEKFELTFYLLDVNHNEIWVKKFEDFGDCQGWSDFYKELKRNLSVKKEI